jgi:opacity protein-like surface antigen
MKKVLLATTAVLGLISSDGYARTHGAFIGLGIASVAHDNDTTVTSNPGVIAIGGGRAIGGLTTDHPNMNKQNYQGDIFAGYGGLIERFYIAGVVNFMFSGPNITNTNGASVPGAPFPANLPYVYKVNSRSGTWGIAARFGYEFYEKFLPYIRLGVEYRRFQLFLDAGDGFASINQEAKKGAFTPGLGIEYKLVERVFVGFEWRVAFYSRITKANTIAPNGLVTFKTRPRIDTLTLSVRYQF